MNTEEHLNKIKAKCQALLAQAEKRTKGRWELGINAGSIVSSHAKSHYKNWVAKCDSINGDNDAVFIAACAGPAEAGWRATIAAIEILFHHWRYTMPLTPELYTMQQFIITAWPEELL